MSEQNKSNKPTRSGNTIRRGGPAKPFRGAKPGGIQRPRNPKQIGVKGMHAHDADALMPGAPLVITIKRIGINGEGVGYYRRKAVFITNALPGEIVHASVTNVHSTYIEAKLTKVEKKSSDRIDPKCPVYDECGGCQLQHAKYESHGSYKAELIQEAFTRYAGVEDLPIRSMASASEPWGYRNKAQFQVQLSFNAEGKPTVELGLYKADSHDLVDAVKAGCAVQHPMTLRVMEKVKTFVNSVKAPIHHPRHNPSGLRTVVTRVSMATKEVQLTFVTGSANFPPLSKIVERVQRELPEVTTIAHNIQPNDTSLVFGEETRIIWGKPEMTERFLDLDVHVSPRAFLQLNPVQTEKLYRYVMEAANLQGTEQVADMHCGTGAIALSLAPLCGQVRGVDTTEEAIEDAKKNAEKRQAKNSRFFIGKAESWLPRWLHSGWIPNVVVLDPPRSGCEEDLLRGLIRREFVAGTRIVYVSCNPATLAKDANWLLKAGYQLKWIQPVDMFPQTAHVEAVALFIRK